MKDFNRAIQLLKTDGIKAIYHAGLMKLREREKEQTKYNKWIQRFEYQMPIEKADNDSAFSITLIYADENMWAAIDNAESDYLAFCYKGDKLTDDWKSVISAYFNRHKEIRFLYTDEDFYSDWIRKNPVFKPEWSPDTYRSYDYIGGLFVLERKLAFRAKEVLSETEGMAERYGNCGLYALGLCAAELVSEKGIGHLKRVLYHRTGIQKKDKGSLLNVKNDLIKRNGLNAFAEYEPKTGEVRVVYNSDENIKVSIVVPSKDQSHILETCMKSVNQYTDYENYEWIIVDNGSNDVERKKYESLADLTDKPFKYIYEKADFNFAAMCNRGEKEADGDCLVFMNDDIEFFEKSKGWLSRMTGQAMQKHTGVVGAKLLYPDTSLIQHIGVVNYARGAAHILNQADDRNILHMNRNCLDVNVSVATGALLAVERSKFNEAGGFCEELKVTYNDVELCFSLLEKGYYNIVRSDVVAFHHESLARGEDALDMDKYRRCLMEREKLYALHPEFIGVDKYYHPYLTQTDLYAGVTTLYLPPVSKARPKADLTAQADNEKIKYRIDSIEFDEWMRVRGYAFSDNRKREQVKLILKGEKTFEFDTTPVFNHTYTHVFNDGKGYAFVGFETVFEHRKLPGGEYKLFIRIGKHAVKTDRSIIIDD